MKEGAVLNAPPGAGSVDYITMVTMVTNMASLSLKLTQERGVLDTPYHTLHERTFTPCVSTGLLLKQGSNK